MAANGGELPDALVEQLHQCRGRQPQHCVGPVVGPTFAHFSRPIMNMHKVWARFGNLESHARIDVGGYSAAEVACRKLPDAAQD